MSDLISRQAAIDALERQITETRWFDFGLRKAQEVLNGLPSAEPEPVVQCKDCKFWIREKAEAGEAGTYCGEADGMIKPGPDDFCSRGRRKERDDRSHPFADDVMMGGGEE